MRYQVIHPIRHNGSRYVPPEIIEMPEFAAAVFLRLGVLHALPAEQAENSGSDAESGAEEEADKTPKRKGAKT